MARFKLLLEYEGTNYCGWQVQNDEPSIQAEVEKALSTVLREPVGVVGSGRTDSGVHARGQAAHFDFTGRIDPFRLKASLNGLLPSDISVLDLAEARPDFHARYDAVLRCYRYYVSTTRIALERHYRVIVPTDTDFDVMNQSAGGLLGEHDFTSYCRTQSETRNRMCNVQSAVWSAENRPGLFHFEITADRFLHGMVRTIVGTLLEVSRGKRGADGPRETLDMRDRRAAGPAAPALGLVLEYVVYPD